MGRHKSDSIEQQMAEAFMRDLLNRRLDLSLQPQSFKLNRRAQVQLDGFDEKKRTLCEVYAHIGPLKGGQPDKVAGDILKMLLVEKYLGGCWRKIYCFADEIAKRKLIGISWLGACCSEFGIEPEVVELPKDKRVLILDAQARQTMVNK